MAVQKSCLFKKQN